MSDLIDDPIPGQNAPEFTVSEISGAVKRMIEGEFGRVRIKGELGRVMSYRSGHIYLDLKDDKAVLAGVIWKGQAARMSVKPEEGMEVVATGRLTTFPGQSKYQMVIEDIRPAGVGALMAMLEKRKAALQAEGLFDPARKKELPYLPEVIGVVTSPQGAVIRDILHRLRDRFPRRVLIWPVAVQGKACASQVAAAIEGFNRLTPDGAIPRPDLLIVARGGGSIEDLWGFNEEIVARAAAASQIPLISAVGHETDTTLIDFVSDRRAPTPTAAAELAVPVRIELLSRLDDLEARLTRAATQGVAQRQQRLRDLGRALPRPETLVATAVQKLDLWGERLPAALRSAASAKRVHLTETAGSLRPALLRRVLAEQSRRMDTAGRRLAPGLMRAVREHRKALDHRASGLRPSLLTREARQKREVFDGFSVRLRDVAAGQVRRWRERIEALERLRQSLGYEETLKRGYAVVWGDGSVVTNKAAAAAAARLEIQFHDGRLIPGGAASPKPNPNPKSGAKPAAKSAPDPKDQGSLF